MTSCRFSESSYRWIVLMRAAQLIKDVKWHNLDHNLRVANSRDSGDFFVLGGSAASGAASGRVITRTLFTNWALSDSSIFVLSSAASCLSMMQPKPFINCFNNFLQYSLINQLSINYLSNTLSNII